MLIDLFKETELILKVFVQLKYVARNVSIPEIITLEVHELRQEKTRRYDGKERRGQVTSYFIFFPFHIFFFLRKDH